MLQEISIFDKIFIKISQMMTNENDLEEMNEIAKLLAVSLYFDKKVTVKEFEETKNIIRDTFDTDEVLVSLMVQEKLESYIDGFWNYEKDCDYIMKKILIEGNWLYAECMADIIQADGVSNSENQTLRKLNEIIEARNILLKKLGLDN